MSSFHLHAAHLPRILLPLLAGMFALAVSRNSPQAAEIIPAKIHAYVMAVDEGYGLTECMARGGSCARIVADSWCEAHGHGMAISYGPAEDVTGAIDDTQPAGSSLEPGSYLVTCGE